MHEIDESYRVIRPRHQERLSRQQEREAARGRNRLILSALVGVAVIVIIAVAVLMGGGGKAGDETVAAGDGSPDRSTLVDSPTDTVDDPTDETMVEPAATVPTGPGDAVPTPDPGPGDVTSDGVDADLPGGSGDAAGDPQVVEPPAPTGPLTGTVVRSCGVSGKGDCRITVRSGPSTSDRAVGRMSEGDTAVFECTVMGDEVRSTVLGEATSVWARNERGQYVSMAYLDVPGWDLFETTNPC